MTHSDIVHPRWGRPISQYPRSYTNEALAARLKAPIKAKERAASRTIALRTIEEICMLSEPALEAKVYADTVARITLSKLESILELTRFTSEYENLALPKLIAGGIELLSSVTPSPLAYEYGYLCFRTLVFALNACVLKYGGVWDETIARISSAPPSHRFPIFWDNSATLLIEEIIYYCGDMEVLSKTGPASPRRWLIPAFDPGKLDKLLSTLHSDQKNLLIALRDTGSLGLSALLFILKKHVENKRPYMSTSEYLEQAFLPYFRVLYRYQITLPDLGSERVVARTLCSENMMDLEDEYFIDLDDSRNVIQAYISSTNSPGDRRRFKFHDNTPLDFVPSLVVPGCEDLIPDMFDAALQVLWESVLVGFQLPSVAGLLCRTLHEFCYILDGLERQVKRSHRVKQSWIFKLGDRVIKSDVVGLILRLKLVKPIPEPDDLRGENEPYEPGTSIQQFLNLATLLPPQYLSRLLLQSGSLFDWWKYFISWYLSTAGASLVYYARLLRQSNFPDLSQAYRGANGGQYSPLPTA
ncbi:hypothetical protein RSAG8_12681, partial [Rhizoctonia solani AG-8 WAC10335]